MIKKSFVLLFVLICSVAGAQDFGFGFDEEEAETSSRPFAITMKGEVDLEITPFFDDFSERSKLSQAEIQDISFFNYKFDFTFTSQYIEVYTVLNINAYSIGELWTADPVLKKANYTPLIIDEVFLRAFLGPVNIEAGFRKLTWGRADSGGPLDVTNPVDYGDLRNITDLRARKIARPMLHLTWNAGDFSKLEAVFIPNFTGHRFSSDGRWVPWQVVNMPNVAGEGILTRAGQYFNGHASYTTIMSGLAAGIASNSYDISPESPDMTGIKWFQGGLRYTTTVGSADIGVQYFYGNLFRPSFTIEGIDDFLGTVLPPPGPDPDLLSPQMNYNRYHQIGIDYAQVLFGLNIRAELALHLTEDMKGDMGSVRNPFIGWSFGFDRDIFWGINLNIQCNQTIRLFDSKIGDNPILDAEAGTRAVSTRFTVQFSKEKIDNMETRVVFIWDIEDKGCYIIPFRSWTVRNMTFELSAGIFFGERTSELGYYKDNSFGKFGLKYSF